ncbi:MAG: hypothetical protein LBQ77_04530 [Treponema sp.]|jgi:hypothetical protein|nr:hypothetical protein [Treponema sp.]
MKKSLYFGIVTLVVAMSFAFIGCSDNDDDTVVDNRKTLSAVEDQTGNTVDADTLVATAQFKGATGLELTKDDFTITESGATISTTTAPDVSGDIVTVTVAITAVNDTAANKTFTVKINPDSTKIKGTATVTVIQQVDDGRKLLGAVGNVTVLANALGATAQFNNAGTLTSADLRTGTHFAVTAIDGGTATITTANIEVASSGIVSVPITFASNVSGTTEKRYEVTIASGSGKIKGNAKVTITQKAKLPLSVATSDRTVTILAAQKTVVAKFNDASELLTTTNLTAANFIVKKGGTADTTITPSITDIDSDGVITVSAAIPANGTENEVEYTVEVASTSEIVKAATAQDLVTITQKAKLPLSVATNDKTIGVLAKAQTVVAKFTDASDLLTTDDLTAADFIVKKDSASSDITPSVSVGAEGVITVSVPIPPNADTSPVTYTVEVASNSGIIKAASNEDIVTITQKQRLEVAAGSDVGDVDAAGRNVEVEFTDASKLLKATDLASTDFIVKKGSETVTTTISITEIDSDTGVITVSVTIPVNADTNQATYTVGVHEDSEVIKGSETVTITQDAASAG